jgi:hypothetical protein
VYTLPEIPHWIVDLADLLLSPPGAQAVVLGGSRDQGSRDAASDWDLGVYYRGALNLTALQPYGAWSRSIRL